MGLLPDCQNLADGHLHSSGLQEVSIEAGALDVVLIGVSGVIAAQKCSWSEMQKHTVRISCARAGTLESVAFGPEACYSGDVECAKTAREPNHPGKLLEYQHPPNAGRSAVTGTLLWMV